MLRTIIVRNVLIKGILRKAIRTNLTRSLSYECSKRINTNNQSPFLKPKQNAPWRYNILRFYASLPKHVKVPLPALSPTMEAGTIVSWSKKEGDQLSEGDLLCEIETDKATMGFETPEEGYLAKIVVPAGTKDVKIGQLVCIIVENAADVAAFKDYKDDGSAAAPAAPAPSAPAPSAPAPAPAAPPPSPAPAIPSPAPAAPSSGARVYASPLAKKVAREGNIQLQGKGSGVYDSITSKDLAGMSGAGAAPAVAGGRQSPMAQGLADAQVKRGKGPAPASAPAPAKAAKGAAPSAPMKPGTPSTFVDKPISNIRVVIAKRLMESKLTIPHYYVTNHCCADKMIALRKKINKKYEKQGVRISINDFIMKATACASVKVPDINASWMGDKMRHYDNVDISLAVSTPTGLITPIIFTANSKGIMQISAETKILAAKARDNKLQPHEFQGGTITVSNLGMFGTSQFNAIVNPPQCAILAIGTNEPRLVADEDSDRGFKVAQYISFTLSADHRVVDGAMGAEWLKAFRGYIEDPETMIF